MKKLALVLDSLVVESFDTTPWMRAGGGTVRGHDSVQPVGDTSASCQGTCYESDCNNNTYFGVDTCDTSCVATDYYTCNATDIECVEYSRNTCVGCYSESLGPRTSCTVGGSW